MFSLSLWSVLGGLIGDTGGRFTLIRREKPRTRLTVPAVDVGSFKELFSNLHNTDVTNVTLDKPRTVAVAVSRGAAQQAASVGPGM
jgi:hypothetical protein